MSITDLSESIQPAILLALDFGIIAGGLGVVLLQRIVYSALLLGLVFVCVALYYLLLGADFLAAAQVLIYVGAVNVLIVFAIMLIIKPEYEISKSWGLGNTLSASLVTGLLGFLMTTILTIPWQANNQVVIPKGLPNPFQGSVEKIGTHFLTDLLLPFELLSILLLVALIGAITIARKQTNIVGLSNTDTTKQ